ncbi:MAG: UDP-N-acetylmuramate dehydrogenase [Verrucomicrobia bacterium]|nr:UDP-N-acetylmuramate dehydrogenase [Verrucomicrobiota bacterium]OQC67893.1 MAG: UDP-N-acetylenolpyruvoylglucosamine reductase [Verrucomicrobia bacterium ADurb.Bin006]MDI9382416.1 UDP-N-acetylmuramate dehydrogenase [Verrucomicrobiota bacterium]NMD19099.1 UDP-N-acetylmuramate dehydrogenase [Verrucomicrobiota bacterium]HNU98953.1 UDP-N-acetylmuramate dehydrogenase [Verrucomicrobiota bacterium]
MSTIEPRAAESGVAPGPLAELRAAHRGMGRPDAAFASELALLLSGGAVIRLDEPLARRTTLRVGGVADLYVEPAQERDLAAILAFCRERRVDWLVLGRGSNLVVRDGGYRGVVIGLAQPAFSAIACEGLRVSAGAGALLKAVVAAARRENLGGFEFLEGIPGSLGGALRMNAGANGSWLFEILERVRIMDRRGNVLEMGSSDLAAGYRDCPFFADHIALSAVLRGEPSDPESIQNRSEGYRRRRLETQPRQPSAGCVFKNPASIAAGRLIEELGFKGERVGGAQVSPIHGNFIVNVGGATARDILVLIERIRERAQSERGIALETEVKIVGED